MFLADVKNLTAACEISRCSASCLLFCFEYRATEKEGKSNLFWVQETFSSLLHCTGTMMKKLVSKMLKEFDPDLLGADADLIYSVVCAIQTQN